MLFRSSSAPRRVREPGRAAPLGVHTGEVGWQGTLAANSVRRFEGSLGLAGAMGTHSEIRVGHCVRFLFLRVEPDPRRGRPGGKGETEPLFLIGGAYSSTRPCPAACSGAAALSLGVVRTARGLELSLGVWAEMWRLDRKSTRLNSSH